MTSVTSLPPTVKRNTLQQWTTFRRKKFLRYHFLDHCGLKTTDSRKRLYICDIHPKIEKKITRDIHWINEYGKKLVQKNIKITIVERVGGWWLGAATRALLSQVIKNIWT